MWVAFRREFGIVTPKPSAYGGSMTTGLPTFQDCHLPPGWRKLNAGQRPLVPTITERCLV